MLIGTTKYQAFALLVAGALIIPATAYEKYKEDSTKQVKLAIYTPIALAFLTIPLILYRRNANKTLRAIDFNLPSNSLELTTYRKHILTVPIQQLSVNYSPNNQNIIHELCV